MASSPLRSMDVEEAVSPPTTSPSAMTIEKTRREETTGRHVKMSVVYEVNLTVQADVREQYETWLSEHIQQLVNLDGFESATWYARASQLAHTHTHSHTLSLSLARSLALCQSILPRECACLGEMCSSLRMCAGSVWYYCTSKLNTVNVVCVCVAFLGLREKSPIPSRAWGTSRCSIA